MDFPPFWFSEKWPFGKKCHVCSPFADWGFVPPLKSFTNTRPPWKPLYWKMRGALIWELLEIEKKKNREKVQRTRGLSSGYQSNFFRSCNKFSNKSWSDFIFIISTKQQLQNLNQISGANYWLNFSFKISPELQLQNLDQTINAQSLDKNLILWPNFSLQICNKLSSTRFWASTSATVTTSTSSELASSQVRVTSIKFTKQEWVSQSVSQLVSDKHSQWSDSGPIKINHESRFLRDQIGID